MSNLRLSFACGNYDRVEALRNGVSEASVRSAAGWSSGAMVARYTRALSGELAVSEFHQAWENR